MVKDTVDRWLHAPTNEKEEGDSRAQRRIMEKMESFAFDRASGIEISVNGERLAMSSKQYRDERNMEGTEREVFWLVDSGGKMLAYLDVGFVPTHRALCHCRSTNAPRDKGDYYQVSSFRDGFAVRDDVADKEALKDIVFGIATMKLHVQGVHAITLIEDLPMNDDNAHSERGGGRPPTHTETYNGLTEGMQRLLVEVLETEL